MKKALSLILVALFALTTVSLVACGSINDSEVSILWSGNGKVEAPDSLINCIERAMYIENIRYKNYGAEGNAEKQYDQAKAAVEGGCAVLVVEPVLSLDAGRYIELAKSKKIPVIFIGDDVLSTTVTAYGKVKGAYDKCIVVKSNSAETSKVQGKLIAEYVRDNFDKLDRNDDGKISYVNYSGNIFAGNTANEANALLKEDAEYEIKVGGGCSKETTRTELVFYDAKNKLNALPTVGAGVFQLEIMEKYNDDSKNTVELIITDNDITALEVLVALQSKGFNTDKLTTHNIPVFTVGFEADYKEFVLNGMPKDESKKDEYLAEMKYLCDLTVVEDEDVDIMIWNTKNVIASGRIAGTVIEDQDAIAGAVAAIIRNFVKDKETFDGLNEENVSGKEYLVPCITNN